MLISEISPYDAKHIIIIIKAKIVSLSVSICRACDAAALKSVTVGESVLGFRRSNSGIPCLLSPYTGQQMACPGLETALHSCTTLPLEWWCRTQPGKTQSKPLCGNILSAFSLLNCFECMVKTSTKLGGQNTYNKTEQRANISQPRPPSGYIIDCLTSSRKLDAKVWMRLSKLYQNCM